MDQTADGVFFETGDKVRLTHPYPELEQGKEGVFMQYIGEFALVEFDEVHAPISPYDLERVPEPSHLFQSGDRVQLTQKCGVHKEGALATFMQYYSDPGEATVQFDGGIMPFDQVPVAWLKKVKEA